MSLPDGYRVKNVGGRLYLFDPQGIPLHGPKDPSLIEAYAWRHAWRRLERELNEEIAALHAGARPMHTLHRLRQYMRMLEAAGGRPQNLEPPSPATGRRLVAWGALAAAAVAAVLWLLPATTPQGPIRTAGPAVLRSPERTALAKHQAPAAQRVTGASRHRVARRIAQLPATGAASVRPVYAVSVGEFGDAITAESMMHLVRSKGYIVSVTQYGDTFVVVTRPYRTRRQAEHLANALQEIGLPAQLAGHPNI
jgi:hypothetical protein